MVAKKDGLFSLENETGVTSVTGHEAFDRITLHLQHLSATKQVSQLRDMSSVLCHTGRENMLIHHKAHSNSRLTDRIGAPNRQMSIHSLFPRCLPTDLSPTAALDLERPNGRVVDRPQRESSEGASLSPALPCKRAFLP